MNPFAADYDKENELALIGEAQSGSKTALEKLVKLHQRFIYNLALKMMRDPEDAADLTQEVLVKMVTRLGQFKGKSSFRTWLYRITFNHFMSCKRGKDERMVQSFDELGEFLDKVHDAEEMALEDRIKYSRFIDDTRNRCITGMLLCLDRQQRIVFILGAILNIKSTLAAPALGMSAANFRQQLSRTRADLFQFMNNKCGLINPDNPCRCYKKTMGFIKEGKVDPLGKNFPSAMVESIESISPRLNDELDQVLEANHLKLFRIQPFEHFDASASLAKTLLFDQEVNRIFRIN